MKMLVDVKVEVPDWLANAGSGGVDGGGDDGDDDEDWG